MAQLLLRDSMAPASSSTIMKGWKANRMAKYIPGTIRNKVPTITIKLIEKQGDDESHQLWITKEKI